MTAEQLMSALGLVAGDTEVSVDFGDTIFDICRTEDDSQGFYLVVDQFATDHENWQ